MDGNTNNTQFPDSNASTCHVEKPKIYVLDFDNEKIGLIEFQSTVLRLVVPVELFEWGVSPCPSSLKWIVEEMNDKFQDLPSFTHSLSLKNIVSPMRGAPHFRFLEKVWFLSQHNLLINEHTFH